MKKIALVLALLVATPAFAQAPPPTEADHRLSVAMQLLNERSAQVTKQLQEARTSASKPPEAPKK